MGIIRLFRDEMRGSLAAFWIVSALGGLSNLGLIASINAQAGAHIGGQNWWILGVFLLSLGLFVTTHHYLFFVAVNRIESIVHRLRERVLDAVRQSELSSIEVIGRSRIVSAAIQDAAALAQAAPVFVFSIQSFLLIVFVGLYITYLSPMVSAFSLIIVGAASAVLFTRGNQIQKMEQDASTHTATLLDYISALLAGFKEVKLNRLRNDQLFDDLAKASEASANAHRRAEIANFRRVTFSQLSLFILLAASVFVAPSLSSTIEPTVTTKITMALLFITGSAMGLLQYFPGFMSANVAVKNMTELETELRTMMHADGRRDRRLLHEFRTIEFSNVVYQYHDKNLSREFTVGPLNFELRSGQVVVIIGGNGSGKSTFLKLLAGIYTPQSGEIRLDGILINDEMRDAYRSLMVAIFGDHYLFKRLYGIEKLDVKEANDLLSQFGVAKKTRILDGEFETIDLSEGQCRRLALLVALLEKRPVMLLDEWAANQDSLFRRKFYRELLPAFRLAGTTLVLVSHDDQYLNELGFPVRILRMDEGRFAQLGATRTQFNSS
jgi:cyclic peptide transporter